MSYLNIDTKRLEKDYNDLVELNNNYNDCIDNLKYIINNIDYWNGADADNFIKDFKESCTVYDEIGLLLKQYASYLQKCAFEVNRQAQKDLIK